MEPARFNDLVASLSVKARANPAAFRRRVRLLVALGYAYVLGVLLLVLGAIVAIVISALVFKRGYVAVKLLLVLVPLAYILLRALWVRFPDPSGVVLDPKRAPRLARRAEEIRRALKAPAADVILLTQDFNASVTQVSRFGILGGERTYLMLGIPLMYALGPRLLDAVLAHEFGHLSGAHPKFGLWVGRVSITWGQLLDQLEASQNWGTAIFRRFTKWYVPQLNAHSFALRRDDEFAADADSARITSPRLSGQALATLATRGPQFELYWKDLFARVEQEPLPPERSWSLLPEWFRETRLAPEREAWLAAELAREGLVEDSHPPLRARLDALKVLKQDVSDPAVMLADLVPDSATLSADHYLGELAPKQLVLWDREWRDEALPGWQKRHAEVKKGRERLAELLAREDDAGRTAAETWELACLLAELDGDDAALPWLERTVAADPHHAAAHFVLGRALLARRDPAGTAAVERAMQLDVQAVPAGAELLRRYHASVGDASGIARAEAEAHARGEEYEATVRERAAITRADTLTPAQLSAKDRETLAAAARVRGVKALWVARRKLKHETGTSVLLVLVEPRSKFWTSFGGKRARLAEAVLEKLQLEGRHEVFLVSWADDIDWLVKKVKAANGAKVTARRGIVAVRKEPWFKVHRRPLILAGIGGAVIGGVAWLLYIPERLHDPRGIIPAADVPQWNNQLAAIMWESGVDLHIIIDSLEPGTDLSAVALREARRRGVGRTSDRRGLLLLVDATTGDLRLEVGPSLEGHFPDGFVGHLLRAHTSGAMRELTMTRSLNSTIMVLHHRLHESLLGFDYDPSAKSLITDSTRLAAGAGATFSFAGGAPLQLDRAPDPALEAALAPGATAEATLARYLQWVSLPVYVPNAHFLTPSSRHYLSVEMKMTPVYWEFLRHLAIDTEWAVETRGDLAVAYATENPLITPLYFRRTEAGWQMDIVAEVRNSQNVVGGGYNWTLRRSGDDFDVAFADMIVESGPIRRYRYGANQAYAFRGAN